MSQRQCLICYILIRLHLVSKLIFRFFSIFKNHQSSVNSQIHAILLMPQKVSFQLTGTQSKYLVSDFVLFYNLTELYWCFRNMYFSLLQAYRFSQLPEMVMGSPPPPVPPRTGPVAVASLRRYLSVILFQAWSLKTHCHNKNWDKP